MKKNVLLSLISIIIALIILLFGNNLIGRFFTKKENPIEVPIKSPDSKNQKDSLPEKNSLKKSFERNENENFSEKREKTKKSVEKENRTPPQKFIDYFTVNERFIDSKFLTKEDANTLGRIEKLFKKEELLFKDILYKKMEIHKAKNVKNVLHGFFYSYTIADMTEVFIDRMLYERFNRDPENIKKFYKRYKQTIFALVPKQIYKSAKIDVLIENLLHTYNFMSVVPGFPEDFNKLKDKRLYESLHNIGKFADNSMMKEINDEMIVAWYHSFWVRRYFEGNIDEVYTILKDIKSAYSQN